MRDKDFDTHPSIVEVICEDEENYEKTQSILDDAVAEIAPGGTINKDLRCTILSDVSVIHGPKMLMLKKYSEILQSTYHRNPSDPPEIIIKKILITVVPKVMLLRLKPKQPSQAESSPATLNSDEIAIVKYLSGALLRWGLKKFKGHDAKYISTLVAHVSATEADATGVENLITPSNGFLSLIVDTESHLRPILDVGTRSIDAEALIDAIALTNSSGLTFHPILRELIRRFIRLRLHIHCKRLITRV